MESTWTIGHLFVGLIIALIGFIVVWKADWMLTNFGRVPMAEKYLSTEGGSRLFFKLIGILFMIIGIMYATNLLTPFGSWIFNKFFGSYIKKPSV